MSFIATTKLRRGAASYTADTRERVLPSAVAASMLRTRFKAASNSTTLRGR